MALSGDAAEPAATALSNRSECHRQLGAPAAAADDATEALRRAPGHAKARLRRAAALEAMERFAEAYEGATRHAAAAAKLNAQRCRSHIRHHSPLPLDFRAVLDADPGAAAALAGVRRTRGVLGTAAAAAASDRGDAPGASSRRALQAAAA